MKIKLLKKAKKRFAIVNHNKPIYRNGIIVNPPSTELLDRIYPEDSIIYTYESEKERIKDCKNAIMDKLSQSYLKYHSRHKKGLKKEGTTLWGGKY